MPAYIGDTAIGGVYVGDVAAEKVYLGDELIWSAVAAWALGVVSVGTPAANGASGSNTAAVTPGMPPGAQAGDRILVFVDSVFAPGTPPTNWNLFITRDAGSSFPSAGAGIRRASVYWRDYDGAWSMPSFVSASAANNAAWAVAVAVRSTPGYLLDPLSIGSAVNAAYNAASTSYTDTTNGSVQTISGALLFANTTLTDAVTAASGGALSQSGGSFDTVTKLADGNTTLGFDVAGTVFATKVINAALATITHTMTLSGAAQGESVLVQQAERFINNAGLTDDFSTALDTTKWETVAASNGTVPSTTGGLLRLNTGNGTLGGAVYSRDVFPFAGGSFVFQAPLATSNRTFYVGVGRGQANNAVSATKAALVVANGTSLSFQTLTGSTLTRIGAFATHTAGNWYRIRESGGTIFWDMAPNSGGAPGAWTNQRSVAFADLPTSADGDAAYMWRIMATAQGPTTNVAMDLDNFTLTP